MMYISFIVEVAKNHELFCDSIDFENVFHSPNIILVDLVRTRLLF